MNILKDGSNWSYAAYASRLVYEEEGKLRSGVEFEVTDFKRVSAFLTRDRNAPESNQKEEYRSLLYHYLEHGPENTEFYQKKLAYFGNEEEVYYLTVWFNESAEADQIELTSWYYIREGEDYDCYAQSFVESDEYETARCSVKAMRQEENLTLETLFQLKTHDGNKQQSAEGQLNAISRDTLFFGVDIYYVGAALCVGLCSAQYRPGGYWVPNRIEGYFDFGISSGSGSHNAYVQEKAVTANTNLAAILADLVSQPDKIIIISHWHKDHISIVRHILSATYDTFWARSSWYVPYSASPVSIIVANRLHAPSGNITVLPNSNPAVNTIYKISNNNNLTYGKIDAFTDPHPHHHGIYAKIKLADLAGEEFETMLLAGDCTYSGIPTAQKASVSYLQACHHGGDYALPPSTGNRTVHIPVPKNDPTYRGVFYSANGVTHGHPNKTFVEEHTMAGWTNRYITRLAGNGGKFWVEHHSVT
jgi:hypothetical protein